ncbi:hypothetical protein ACFUTV_41090 [Streptomyces sp. NPDC057298]|uniref:hypothetical protein n=1 Tax=Streptomyces sp. NPDC057298 TaxID=3346091 RepID=UPI00363B901E
MTQLHSQFQPSETASADDFTDAEEIYRPGDGVSEEYGAPSTAIADWVMVSPQIDAFSFRVYCVLRALIITKQARPRQISPADLAEMIPGDSGSAVSTELVERALEQLQAVGLVTRLSHRLTVTAGNEGPGAAQ